jgi:integrase
MTNQDRSLVLQGAKIVLSRDGYVFEPSASHWKLSRDRTISLEWTSGLLANTLCQSLIKLLTHYATRHSADHTRNICELFHLFAIFAKASNRLLDRITSSDLISYRHTLDRQHEWHLGTLRGFLKTWAALDLPGIDADVPSLLAGWSFKGNVKGLAVQTRSPSKGPLTDLEYEAFQQGLLESFERDEVSLSDFVLALLFSATGRRPAQLADIKCGDFVEARSSEGLCEFFLNIPRRKARGRGWRAELKVVALTSEIGLALRGLVSENGTNLRSMRGDASCEMLKLLPLFPLWKTIEVVCVSETDAFLRMLATEDFHVTTEELRNRLLRTVSALAIPSERTGGTLRVFPTRLRRSLATRAAREGYGALVIAELLDHADDQSARVYTENVPEIIDAINEAVARHLAPIAQAFSGVLVDRESDASRGNDPASRVRTGHGAGAGTCGHFGFCGALAPIACYTCRHFQPWLDGSHEEILHGLMAERDRIFEVTQDRAVAAINDRTIFAVTEVIQRCEARRIEMAELVCHG